ncbi:MAG: phosphoribosylformimino-5-aminoimidazole carboxamide ribotide isomerase [Saprospiraceae bacterium]|jgi:phosphoribosylformimino-5-aminoimidazole carboxamide ribotide isomerase
MILIPAIDLIDGQAVRLRQGDYSDSTVFSPDPVAVADRWVAEGARRLHIVDLDGAKAGEPINADIVKQICQKYPDLPVQIGGGIRNRETVKAYLDAGVSYVIIGTKAVDEPAFIAQLCEEFGGEHIIVGLDAKGDKVATQGWLTETEMTLIELAQQFEYDGISSIIYTDIARDGMLQGANSSNTHKLATAVSIPVIAAGGVHQLQDLEELAVETQGKLAGAITGRAIYEGTLDFAQGQQLLDDLVGDTA